MAQVLIITPAMAAYLLACIEQDGGENAPDDAAKEAAVNFAAELRSWSDSGMDAQVTFERHEDEDD